MLCPLFAGIRTPCILRSAVPAHTLRRLSTRLPRRKASCWKAIASTPPGLRYLTIRLIAFSSSGILSPPIKWWAPRQKIASMHPFESHLCGSKKFPCQNLTVPPASALFFAISHSTTWLRPSPSPTPVFPSQLTYFLESLSAVWASLSSLRLSGSLRRLHTGIERRSEEHT